MKSDHTRHTRRTRDARPTTLSRRRYLEAGLGLGATAGLLALSTGDVAAASPKLWTVENTGHPRDVRRHRDTLYLGTDAGVLRGLSAQNGVETASADLLHPVHSRGLAVDDNTLVAATEDDRLTVFQRHGLSQLWKRPISGSFRNVVARDGRIVLGTSDEIVALDAETGAVRWQRDHGTWRDLALASDHVLVRTTWDSTDHYSDVESVVALNPRSGQPEWSAPLPDSSYSVSRFDPAVAETDSRLAINYIDGGQSGGKGGLRVFERESGTVLWTQNEPESLIGPTAVTGDRVAFATGSSVRVYSIRSGESTWTANLRVGPNALAAADGTVYAAGETADGHRLMALKAASGVIEWEASLGGTAYTDLLVGDQRLVLVNSETGDLAAFPRNGSASDGSDARGKSDGRASFRLTAEQTTVPRGETTTLRLSVVNLIDSEPMTVQLLLETPSGVQVTSVDGADEGSNQYTAVVTVPAGGEENLGIAVRANEVGGYSVPARAMYHFGDDEDRADVQSLAVEFEVTEPETALNATTARSSETEGTADSPGFSALGTLGALGGGIALLRERLR